MQFFRRVKKSKKAIKSNLRKKIHTDLNINEKSDFSSESGDNDSVYTPSESELEMDSKVQEYGDQNLVKIKDFLVLEGLMDFAKSISGGSKSTANAMLWVKRTAHILQYTYYEIHRSCITFNDNNDDILRYVD
jgi:hypothetical protein